MSTIRLDPSSPVFQGHRLFHYSAAGAFGRSPSGAPEPGSPAPAPAAGARGRVTRRMPPAVRTKPPRSIGESVSPRRTAPAASPTTGTPRNPTVAASGPRERVTDWLAQKAKAVARGPL